MAQGALQSEARSRIARPSASEPPIEHYVAELIARARTMKLAEHRTWWRLLHYESSIWGVKSAAGGKLFFNAETGREDPDAELAATLRAFFITTGEDVERQHPLCRFPARLAWLHAQIDFDLGRLPRPHCERWKDFERRTRAESVTLVFSSYYLNAPASAFGHSFMRLNKRPEPGEERQELLDYGIDFSANVDTDNALLYAFKGLTGLFPGQFSKRPYYFKVREYNDFESRDLWEFQLDLTPSQVSMAVAHIWELGSAVFPYYYLTLNCSFQMLGILEVANPALELQKYVGWPVIPVDTVKALFHNPGLVKDVRYRPSVRSQFRYRLGTLAAKHIDLVYQFAKQPNSTWPSDVTLPEQLAILDAAADFIDVEYAHDLLDLGSEGAALKHRLLARRATLAAPSPALELPNPREGHPASGHDSRRLGLGPGWASDIGWFQELDVRLALHDLTDPAQGYPAGLAISFLPTRLRYAVETPGLTLEDFSIVEILSLTPQDRFDHSWAWNFRLGATRLRDEGCHCVAPLAEIGTGAALSAGDGALLFFANLSNRLASAPRLKHGLGGIPLRFAIGPRSGVRVVFSPDWVFFGEAEASYLPLQKPVWSWRAGGTLRWQYRPDFSLSAGAERQSQYTSVSAASSIYF